MQSSLGIQVRHCLLCMLAWRPCTDGAKESRAGGLPMGSPSGVPVPCTATAKSLLAGLPADIRALRKRAACAGPLGAVRLLERPSWLTADACKKHANIRHASPNSKLRHPAIADYPYLYDGKGRSLCHHTEQQHCNSLAAAVAIRRCVKSLTSACGREGLRMYVHMARC